MSKLYAQELDEAFEITLTQNNLSRLTEAISSLLKNPISVYDTSYYILAYSNLKNISDPVWLEGMKRGYCHYEYAAQFNKLMHSAPSNSQFITSLGNVRRRQSTLYMDGTLVGYFSILESETPFEQISQEYYDIAAKLLAKEIGSFYARRDSRFNTSYHGILLDLLEGNFANKKLFCQRLKGSELDISTTFLLITIEMDGFASYECGKEQLRPTLSRYLPDSWSAYYAKSIVILLNGKNPYYRKEHAFDAFEKYLQENHLRCCISDCFDDLFYIKEHYYLTLYTLEVAKEQGTVQTFLQYENYKLSKAISLLPEEDIKFLCSALVRALYKEDLLKGTNYLQTLFFYLHNGKSLQKTAKNLYVHRNTVAYRIQHIREKYDVNFQDEYRNIHHYFSCMMLLSRPPGN